MIRYYLNSKHNDVVQTLASSSDWDQIHRWCVIMKKAFNDPINYWVAAEPVGEKLYELL